MKTQFLKLALLAVFCVGATATNAQTNLSEEAVKVIKELKQVDTKGLSADEAQTVMKVLNQIKRENSPRVEMPEIYFRGSQTCYPCVELAGMKVDAISIAEKPLFILNGKEISIEEFNRLNPNCVVDLKLIKGEEAVNKYGEKAANGVLVITAKKDNAEKVQVTGFTTVIKGDVTTEPIANVDLAVKAVNQGNVLVILDGIEISEEKFKSLDPNSIEKLELRKGETMKVLYGEKAANGVLFITSVKAAAENEQRAARRANAQNVHVVTKADLKPVNREAMAKVMSRVEPMFHVRGSMARIENINSDELPVISKFKQNGNQVSFRIEVPKSANQAKQKVDIEYELPAEK